MNRPQVTMCRECRRWCRSSPCYWCIAESMAEQQERPVAEVRLELRRERVKLFGGSTAAQRAVGLIE